MCFHCNLHSLEANNIINNSQGSSTSYGILYTEEKQAELTINECCFIKNCGNGEKLFYANSGTIINVKNCFIQNGFTILGEITLSNIVSTDACNYMIVGYLEAKAKRTVCKYDDFFITRLVKLTTLNNINIIISKP
jgi:hypothetical protein